MVAKSRDLFFSTVVIIASALVLSNHSPRSVLFLGLAGILGIPFFQRLNLGWVLQIGSLGSVGALSIESTPINCILSIALAFSQAYLLGVKVLKYFFDVDLDNLKKVKPQIKCKVEEVSISGTINPLLIEVEPAKLIKFNPGEVESAVNPNLKKPVSLLDTEMTLKYAKDFFALDEEIRAELIKGKRW